MKGCKPSPINHEPFPMILAAIVLTAIIVLAVFYVFVTSRGSKLDDLIVSGDLERIKKELQAHPQGFRPRRGGSDGPLHLAAHRSQTSVVSLLLEHGVDPNAKDIHGNTPLHEATVSERNAKIVELLVAHGADVNARNNQGYTPLAVAREWKKQKIADLLIQLGAMNEGDR